MRVVPLPADATVLGRFERVTAAGVSAGSPHLFAEESRTSESAIIPWSGSSSSILSLDDNDDGSSTLRLGNVLDGEGVDIGAED